MGSDAAANRTAEAREHWGSVAEAFNQSLSAMTDACIPALLSPLGDLRGRRVLDIGCGPGHSTAEIERRGGDVIGADIAEPMVELARKLAPSLTFQVADAEALPFEDRSFDAACGNFVVPFFGKPERAAAELARVLKPGGRIALSIWDVDSRARVFGMLAEAAVAARVELPPIFGAQGRLRFTPAGAFEALLRDGGFDDAAVSRYEFKFQFAGAEALFETLLSVSMTAKTMIETATPDAAEKIHQTYVDLANEYASANGIEVPSAALIASGRRPDNARASRSVG